MYTSKRQSASAALRSRRRLETMDCSKMMKCTQANSTPEAIAKRGKSLSAFMKNNPGYNSKRMKQIYKDNPEMIENCRTNMEKNRHLIGNPTSDAEIAEVVAFKIQCYKNGVQVVEYIDCEREKSVGVVRVDE